MLTWASHNYSLCLVVTATDEDRKGKISRRPRRRLRRPTETLANDDTQGGDAPPSPRSRPTADSDGSPGGQPQPGARRGARLDASGAGGLRRSVQRARHFQRTTAPAGLRRGAASLSLVSRAPRPQPSPGDEGRQERHAEARRTYLWRYGYRGGVRRRRSRLQQQCRKQEYLGVFLLG